LTGQRVGGQHAARQQQRVTVDLHVQQHRRVAGRRRAVSRTQRAPPSPRSTTTPGQDCSSCRTVAGSASPERVYSRCWVVVTRPSGCTRQSRTRSSASPAKVAGSSCRPAGDHHTSCSAAPSTTWGAARPADPDRLPQQQLVLRANPHLVDDAAVLAAGGLNDQLQLLPHGESGVAHVRSPAGRSAGSPRPPRSPVDRRRG
jgi:hypothetical protein